MEVIKAEEESFNKTLDRGLEIFEDIVEELNVKGEIIIPGEDAFRLYDTYGFPLDLTRLMAEERKMSVDEEGFETEMEKQRERARKAGKFAMATASSDDWEVLTPAKETKFVGYENTALVTNIHKIARRNGNYYVVLTETPFYAEAGGQVGDRGKIIGDGFELEVVDTQKEGDSNVCICVSEKPLEVKDPEVHAVIDTNLRTPTTYNHTATHLLQAALRKVLGDHVRQAGSLVASDYLRFDFTHFKKVEREQLEGIERIVNENIQSDLAVEYYYTDFETAKKKGAMALFGEKYGDIVRVVSVAPVSLELCGGCHVKHTGQIGPFVITQESNIASGVRRIEALTGPKAVEYIQHSRSIVKDIDQLLNSPAEGLTRRIKDMMEHLRNVERELQQLKTQHVLDHADEYLAQAEKVGEISLVIQEFNNLEIDLLKQLGDTLRQKSKHSVSFLVNHSEDGRVNFICAVTDDLIEKKKLKAGDLVKQAAQIAGGGGGGRPHLATAGAKSADQLPEIYEFLRKELAKLSGKS